MTNISKDFSSVYTLSSEEYNKLIWVLVNDQESKYSAFLIVLLKELNDDINKALRIINTGINTTSDSESRRGIFKKAIYTYLVRAIREAIILSNYKNHIKKDGHISLVKLSNTERFKLAGITRQTVIRAFNKYNIEYNKHTSHT